MDFLPILFLVLIVLMCGGIAVLADEIGRKLGKKRLSLQTRAFKLRPKHVARLGTALAGIGVSLFTILVVTVASSDVRQWIIEGRGALAERDRAVRDRDQAVTELETANQEQVRVRAEFTKLEGRNKQLDLDIRRKSEEVDRLQKELPKLTAQINQLRPRVGRLQASLKVANRRFKEAQESKEAVEKKLALGNRQYAKLQTLLKDTEGKVDLAEAGKAEATKQANDIIQRNTELMLEQERRAREVEDLRLLQNRLEQERERTIAELNFAQDRLTDAQTSLAAAREQLIVAQTEAYQATTAATFFKGISEIPRLQPMTFQLGEEVTRLPVEETTSLKSAEVALTNLLRSARIASLERGAKPNDPWPEAGIFNRVDPRTKEAIPSERIEAEIISRIVQSKGPLVLVAYSSLNAFKGEPVSLEVGVFQNPLVYRKGQVLAETQIDGKRDEMTIFRQLSEFLNKKVRDRAKQDKMIPRGSQDGFGEITPDTVLKLVGTVKGADRTVRLLALADSDTRAADPLKLSFQIR